MGLVNERDLKTRLWALSIVRFPTALDDDRAGSTVVNDIPQCECRSPSGALV